MNFIENHEASVVEQTFFVEKAEHTVSCDVVNYYHHAQLLWSEELIVVYTTDHTGDFGVDQAESDKVLLKTIFKIDVFISVFSQSQIYRLI